MIKIYFDKYEFAFLIQLINKFMVDVRITNFPLKNKLLLNETSFYKEEVEFLYLYLKVFKKTIEKYLDNPQINDENLYLNYKGTNHCLRKCRKSLEEHDVNCSELDSSYNDFFEFFSNNFI